MADLGDGLRVRLLDLLELCSERLEVLVFGLDLLLAVLDVRVETLEVGKVLQLAVEDVLVLLELVAFLLVELDALRHLLSLSLDLRILDLELGLDPEVLLSARLLSLQVTGLGGLLLDLVELRLRTFDGLQALVLPLGAGFVLLLESSQYSLFLFDGHLGIVDLLLFVDGVRFESQDVLSKPVDLAVSVRMGVLELSQLGLKLFELLETLSPLLLCLVQGFRNFCLLL